MEIEMIKPRNGRATWYLERKRKQEELVKLAGLILNECCTTRNNVFNTLCWLEQKGMLNEKSVTAFLKYTEKTESKETKSDKAIDEYMQEVHRTYKFIK